jgi:hypothetical protein
MYNEEDTLYYIYFCRGQGPVIRFFAEMYDQAKAASYYSDTSFFFACAESGRAYLDATKIEGYEDGYIWDGRASESGPDNSIYTISVSVENGPPGLGLAMVDAAKLIGSEQNPNSDFMDLAFHCANWLRAEFHVDLVFPMDVGGGGYKWPWRAAEDSVWVEIVNKSECGTPCVLDTSDTFACSLYVHKWGSVSGQDTIFWWVDFLKWNKRFTFMGEGDNPDSGSVVLAADSADTAIYISHALSDLDNLPQNAKPVSVNGSVGFWVEDADSLFSLDQDCFKIRVIEDKQ